VNIIAAAGRAVAASAIVPAVRLRAWQRVFDTIRYGTPRE